MTAGSGRVQATKGSAKVPKGQSFHKYVRSKAFTISKKNKKDTQRNGTASLAAAVAGTQICVAQDFHSLRCIQIASPQSRRSLLPCPMPPVVCPVALTHHPTHIQAIHSHHVFAPFFPQGTAHRTKRGLACSSSSPSLPFGSLPSASPRADPHPLALVPTRSHTPQPRHNPHRSPPTFPFKPP